MPKIEPIFALSLLPTHTMTAKRNDNATPEEAVWKALLELEVPGAGATTARIPCDDGGLPLASGSG
jgi:hypothetical protein